MNNFHRLGISLGLALTATTSAADELVLEPAADASIFQPFSGDPEAADSQGPHLFVGRILQGTRRRALLRFDLSALPEGATVDAAQLELTLTRTVSGALSVGAHRVTSAWQEGTANAGTPGGQGTTPGVNDPTWSQRAFPATPWTSAGGDFVATASGAFTLDGNADYVIPASVGMLTDINTWRTDAAMNLGWILVSDESQTPPTAKRLESGDAADAATRPRLRISYTLTAPPVPRVPVPIGSRAIWLAVAALFALLAFRSRSGKAQRDPG